MSAPFRPSISRASSGVAISSDSSPRMRTIFSTCSALLSASAPLEVDAVLQADAHVAAHDRADGDQRVWWRPAPSTDRVVVAEQAVGGALHVHEVLDVGADAAEDPEDRLHEQRRLDEAAVEEVREVVEVADVVALELEAGAARADSLRIVSMSAKVFRKMKSRISR